MYHPVASDLPTSSPKRHRIPERICGFKTAHVTVVILGLAAAAAIGGGVGGWFANHRSTSPAPGSDECAWQSYRLPGTVVPSHYDVLWDLSLAFAPPYVFSGSSAAALSVVAPVRCILVHARALSIAGVSVSFAGGEPVPASFETDTFPASDRVIVHLPYAATSTLVLQFNFTGTLSNTVIGFYGSTYVNGSRTVSIVQTKFEPSFARTAFPCLDEPALKATFNLTLRGIPQGYEALGNMPVLDRSAAGSSVTFQRSPIMSTYQLTAVVAPLIGINATLPPTALRPAEVPVTVWAVDRGALTPKAALSTSLVTALSALAFYESELSIPYMLPKADLVYLPVFPVGAMEQWGLITYTEAYLYRNASVDASPSDVIAHELAHQWFGNLVTTAWWDSLWLQEGFATYWPYIELGVTAPTLVPDGYWRLGTQGAMEDDGYAASQALTVSTPITTASDGYAVFGSITYDKGAAVIAGLSRRTEAVASGSFINGIRSYLSARAFGSAVPGDLVAALETSADLASLSTEFHALLFLPGVPLLRVENAPSGAGLVLSITRFFVCPDSAAAAAAAGQDVNPWTSLPLSISAASPSPELLAAASAATAALGGAVGGSPLPMTLPYNATTDGWIVVTNGSATDYVRVLYPPSIYGALGAALQGGDYPASLGPSARMALIDDLFAAAEARTEWVGGDSRSSVNMSFALAWAAGWAGTETDINVRSSLASRLRRLLQLLVDDVPLASCGNVTVLPRAAVNGTAEYACVSSLYSYAAAVGVPLAAVTSNRAALSAFVASPLDAANASNVLSSVAANPYGRDIAWAAFKAGVSQWLAWYEYRSTLGSIARSLAVNFHTRAYAEDQAAFWTGLGLAGSGATGAWQRGVERIVAGLSWAAADKDATCAFLTGGWGGAPAVRQPDAAEGSTITAAAWEEV